MIGLGSVDIPDSGGREGDFYSIVCNYFNLNLQFPCSAIVESNLSWAGLRGSLAWAGLRGAELGWAGGA